MAEEPSDCKSPVRKRRRWLRWLGGLALLGVAAALALLGAFWFALLKGRPLLDEELKAPGLMASVYVARDAYGAPTLTAETRSDAAYALGFLHAQDRFFQMDTLRRVAAGETAEVVGSFSLEFDVSQRTHHCRATAEQVYAQMPTQAREILDAYTQGVNEGLAALGSRPFEYWPLRQTPQAWKPEDSLLVAFAMYFNLQDSGRGERSRLILRKMLTPEAYRFWAENGSPWDAPLDDSTLDIVPIPSAAAFPHLSEKRVYPEIHDSVWEEAPSIGSNAFAVSGSRTVDGRAIVANDMHLGYNVPNTWYRAFWRVPNRETGEETLIGGMTLPGVPLLVTGTNGHIAWGFTNTYADTLDLIELELNPDNPDEYRTADGYEAFTEREEAFRLPGGNTETETYRDTRWGPVMEIELEDEDEPILVAINWIAHKPEALNFHLLEMEQACTLEEALDIAHRSGIPVQNLVFSDATRAAWTPVGALPDRTRITDTGSFTGFLSPEDYPSVVDPPQGLIWTANNRIIGGSAGRLIGDGGYDQDSRGWQIRKRMQDVETHSEQTLLEIQLDSENIFLQRWRQLLLSTLRAEPTLPPKLTQVLAIVENWDGMAAPNSVGQRLVNDFRNAVKERVLGRLLEPVFEASDEFALRSIRYEQPLFMLVSEQPQDLVDPELGSWQAELLVALEDLLSAYEDDYGEDYLLSERTWSEVNPARVQHPLTFIAPFLNSWLSMPNEPVPGTNETPRVQAGRFGQSQRLIVSPGREEEGLFAMPGGQSGHPLSPFYKAGHEEWARGEMLPLLPGEPEHMLILRPLD